jgi:tetratricopeptide (TPR) repeat protein
MGQLIGTPEYMSPEQAEMTNLDIDTRTDVYSLGALLYELLAGAQPFDPKKLRGDGLAEIQRKIREDEPSKPSTRVSGLGEASGTAASNRRVVVAAWVKQLRGDLDWVTMRAMEKDRTRRYASPLELAADVRRYLRHEPVLARPPSTSYRVRKYVRRNRVGVAAAALILLALIIGLAGATAGMIRATRAEKKTNVEAIKAQAINEFLLNTLDSANPVTGGRLDVTVMEALDGARETIRSSFADQPEIEAAVSKTVGRTYLRFSQYDKAERLLQRALEIEERIHGNHHPETVDSLLFLGVLNMEQGRLDEAERLYQQALAGARQLPEDDRDHVSVALFNLGGIAQARGNLDEAESFYRESLAIAPHDDDEMHLDWATTLLAWILAQKGAHEESESLFASAVAGRRNLLGNDHPFVADALLGLGVLTSRQLQNQNAPPPGDCAKAVPMFEEAAAIYDKNYGEEAVQFALPRLFLGGCLTKLERHEEAEQQLLAAYPLLEQDDLPFIISYPPGAGGNRSLKVLGLQAISYLYDVWGKPEKAAEYLEMLDSDR